MTQIECKAALLSTLQTIYPLQVKVWEQSGELDAILTKKVESYINEVGWLETHGLFPNEAKEIAWGHLM